MDTIIIMAASQNKYTRSARGQDCTVRLPGRCNFNPETVVFAHLPGGGMGAKSLPIHGAYCCSSCHDVVDGRVHIKSFKPGLIKLMFLEAVIRTQEIMIENNILKL